MGPESPKIESSAGNQLRENAEKLRFDDMSWERPRNTQDAMVAWIQRGNRHTTGLEYAGLLDEEEKKEFQRGRDKTLQVWKEAKVNPAERINGLIENRWQRYLQAPQAGVSGNVFISEAFGDLVQKETYEHDENEGRLSFSVNLAKAEVFFDLMMTHLSQGVFADIPVKFKMSDAFPDDQGKGEGAHLYFKAGDEERVYKAFTEVVYPALEKNQLLSLGGRFLMIPVKDKEGNTMKGIEFGQSMLLRSVISTEKREKLLSRTGAAYATSGVQAVFMANLTDKLPYDTFERLKNVYKEKGKDELIQTKEFSDAYAHVRRHLIELGRDSNYPMLDRDARQAFPYFTQLLDSSSK